MISLLKKYLRSAYRRKQKLFPGKSWSRAFPPLAPFKAGLIDWLTRDPISIQGHAMFVDLPDSLGLRRNPVYGKEETALLASEVKPGMTVCDIGANIGYYTLLLARWVGPTGRVFAFEPDPVNFALAKKNVEHNGYTNVTLVNCALSNQPGELLLYVCEYNRGDHRSYNPDEPRECVSVEAKTLDAFLESQNNPRIDVIKMDVQGAEPLVCQGAAQFFRENAPQKMLMEFWPQAMNQAGQSAEALLDQLAQAGFDYSLVSKETDAAGLPVLTPVSRDEIRARFTVENGVGDNLWCRRTGAV
jgi:FkbM family methyltransferase